MAKRPVSPVLNESVAGQAKRSSDPRARVQLLDEVRMDYRRHGCTVVNAAFLALVTYRLGRWSERRRRRWSRFLARKLYAAVHGPMATLTRIWIPPAVTLGEGFHIIHAEGSLSIHPDTVIGKRCGVMHNVTIGTNMTSGAPVIGDDVFIGVNASVLGPIRIGDRVRIAANTAVSTHIPSDSIAVGSPARVYPRLGPFRREPDHDAPVQGRIHD
ncbi:MAG: serine acetyltransferase [Pseudorhizobium sp.]